MSEPNANLSTATPEEWATEQRRRYLLSVMGVTPMVSRRDWPGARNAERRAAPAAPDPVAAVAGGPEAGSAGAKTRPAESGKPAAQPRPPMPNMPDTRAQRSAPTARQPSRQPARQPAAQAPQANAGNAVQFSLLIAAGAGYLWIETLPERVLASEQLSLTTAMARALDGGAAPLVYQQFDWPIVANPALPRDLNTAQQSLGALIGRMRKEQASRGIVLMGDCDMLPEPGDAEVLRIPTTLAMLENPMLKAEAWAVLKPRVVSA